MTDQQIRLQFGELNASEMRLARAIVGWHEAKQAKLQAAADGLAEAAAFALQKWPKHRNLGGVGTPVDLESFHQSQAALASYQATKP